MRQMYTCPRTRKEERKQNRNLMRISNAATSDL